MRTIQYGIDIDTGLVVSQVRLHGRLEAVAWPVYQFAEFGVDGDFSGPIPLTLEKWTDDEAYSALRHSRVRWTRKVPVGWKQAHRQVHGFRPLPSPVERSSAA